MLKRVNIKLSLESNIHNLHIRSSWKNATPFTAQIELIMPEFPEYACWVLSETFPCSDIYSFISELISKLPCDDVVVDSEDISLWMILIKSLVALLKSSVFSIGLLAFTWKLIKSLSFVSFLWISSVGMLKMSIG